MKKNSNISTILFSIGVIVSLAIGWHQRDEFWITAEHGWGYALGIIGGSMMLLLLLYPLRKHWRLARNWFSISHWFRMHMLFGVLGPVLILFHSNFQLGSMNSSIALFSMLTVALSGVVGRYVYQKIHRGLYGEQLRFSELENDYQLTKEEISTGDFQDQKIITQLQRLEQHSLERNIGVFAALGNLNRLKKFGKAIRKKQSESGQNKDTDQHLIAAVSLTQGLIKLSSYTLFHRLFSLWHVLHLPIFFMMLIAGIVHVFVVHIY